MIVNLAGCTFQKQLSMASLVPRHKIVLSRMAHTVSLYYWLGDSETLWILLNRAQFKISSGDMAGMPKFYANLNKTESCSTSAPLWCDPGQPWSSLEGFLFQATQFKQLVLNKHSYARDRDKIVISYQSDLCSPEDIKNKRKASKNAFAHCHHCRHGYGWYGIHAYGRHGHGRWCSWTVLPTANVLGLSRRCYRCIYHCQPHKSFHQISEVMTSGTLPIYVHSTNQADAIAGFTMALRHQQSPKTSSSWGMPRWQR